MFDPKYRLLISPESFPKDQFICLGSQLVSVIDALKKKLPEHQWYGADVQAVGKGGGGLNLRGLQLKYIGSDEQFISYCMNISQFMSGAFLCISNDFLYSDISNVELGTEDEPFRSISCDGVLIEVRMFDTSYIEIYSEDEIMLKKISNNFNKSQIDIKP